MRRKARGNLLEKNGGRAWKQTGSSLKTKVKKKISSSLLITNLFDFGGQASASASCPKSKVGRRK
jgi:hypothetical protein